MVYERSCGAVVFTRSGGMLRYLLVSSLQGIYGFPKGHMEPGETPRQTALREVREETNLQIRLVDGFCARDEYPLASKADTVKQVTYFLGSFENQQVIFQEAELSGGYLVPYAEAMALLRFESARRILTEANDFLTGN